MKTLKILSITTVILISILAVACKKENNIKDMTSKVVGTYTGTFMIDGQKSISDAVADVSEIEDGQIEIHCYGSDIDTTFIQRLFEDGEMVQMCSLDSAFYNEYGHNMMDQDEHHDMMNDTEGYSWAHHMAEEHNEGDEHFGYFDTVSGTFDYKFKMMNNDSTYYYTEFNGVKK